MYGRPKGGRKEEMKKLSTQFQEFCRVHHFVVAGDAEMDVRIQGGF